MRQTTSKLLFQSLKHIVLGCIIGFVLVMGLTNGVISLMDYVRNFDHTIITLFFDFFSDQTIALTTVILSIFVSGWFTAIISKTMIVLNNILSGVLLGAFLCFLISLLEQVDMDISEEEEKLIYIFCMTLLPLLYLAGALLVQRHRKKKAENSLNKDPEQQFADFGKSQE